MINRNALWITNWRYIPPASEFIEIKMISDSLGKVYVPTAWSPWLSYPWADSWGNGTYWAPYNRDVYVDWTWSAHISWNSTRQGYREVKSWLEPWTFHFIKIVPHYFHEETWLPDYWRAMAFAMWWSCVASLDLTYKNPIADYLYEILYDWAIMGYKCSDSVIWAWYKTAQFAWCSNLTKPYEEVDVSMVTSIWRHFLAWQYCQSWITESAREIAPDCRAAQTWYREQQYWKCPNLLTAATEVDPPRMWQWYYHSYREWQYAFCPLLTVTAPENPPQWITWWVEYKYNQYRWCTWIQTVSRVEYCPWYWATEFRGSQFRDCGSSSNPLTMYIYWDQIVKSYSNSMWLSDANVYRIYVPQDLVEAYKNDGNWSNISDNKFVWF